MSLRFQSQATSSEAVHFLVHFQSPVSKYIDCIDLEGLGFLVSSIFFLALTHFSPLFQWFSLSSKGMDLLDKARLGLSFPKHLTICLMYDCGSLYLLLSVLKESALVMAEHSTDV